MSRQDAAPTIPNRPTNLAKLRTDILRLAAPNQRGVGSEEHTGPWPGSLHHHAIRGRGSRTVDTAPGLPLRGWRGQDPLRVLPPLLTTAAIWS